MMTLLILSLIWNVIFGHYIYEKYPPTCLEAKKNGQGTGIQNLTLNGRDFTVYCEQTFDDGGWLVIQRRINAQVDFYQNWEMYETGFGNLQESFWTGLKLLHEITNYTSFILRVDLMDFEGNSGYAIYQNFKVKGPEDNYRLTIGMYTGTIGDGLIAHNDREFSTFDKDHDTWAGNCAQLSHGGWWYGACLNACLNGRYRNDLGRDGVVWFPWRNDYKSMKKAEMKIKEWSVNSLFSNYLNT